MRGLLTIFAAAILLMACEGKQTGRISFANPELVEGSHIYIRIFKEESVLELWSRSPGTERYALLKSYPICKYSGDLGPKLAEGDGQSPEGFYQVGKSSLNPNSSYHLSFNLGFPNAYDRAHGRTGSYLMVHGSCVSIGCYAMTNEGIEDIYGAVEQALTDGQEFVSIHIFLFRMNEENFVRYAEDKWSTFWSELKPAYDIFQQTNFPPVIEVEGKAYVILRPESVITE